MRQNPGEGLFITSFRRLSRDQTQGNSEQRPDFRAIILVGITGDLALKQQSFSSLEQAHKKKRTKRESFLGEMDAVVPWARLEALIAPHYTKPRKGRPQMPLSVMLRIYFLQQWYDLSDP